MTFCVNGGKKRPYFQFLYVAPAMCQALCKQLWRQTRSIKKHNAPECLQSKVPVLQRNPCSWTPSPTWCSIDNSRILRGHVALQNRVLNRQRADKCLPGSNWQTQIAEQERTAYFTQVEICICVTFMAFLFAKLKEKWLK